MTIIAKGQLQHHFWGTYHASIGLLFHSAELAAQAQKAFPLFTQSTSLPTCLTFRGKDPELKAALASLYAHGADKRKVESVAHSIDYGDPFTVEVDLTPADTTIQLTFEGL